MRSRSGWRRSWSSICTTRSAACSATARRCSSWSRTSARCWRSHSACTACARGRWRSRACPRGSPARRFPRRTSEPESVVWLDTVLQGVMLGGLYALFATGLSVIFGVMRLVNLAHGDFSILAAFLAVVLVQSLDLNPLVALVLVVPIMGAVGWTLQRLVLNRLLGRGILPAV